MDNKKKGNNYSIENYKEDRFLFTAALNIAYDNCKQKGCLNILAECQHSKGGISDEQIKNVKDGIESRLRDIRNYFSHYYHNENCLMFEKDDPIKVFMEATFDKAVSNLSGSTKESDYKGIEPEQLRLFEEYDKKYRITMPGVVFLASFFCHRSNVNRMMGAIKGLKRADRAEMDDGTKRDYNFTRRLLSYYSLRDSYAVKNEETRPFREILGYLSLVPHEAVDWLDSRGELSNEEKKEFLKEAKNQESKEDNDSTDEKTRRGLRKGNKFMRFAIMFTEDWSKKENLEVTFARYEKQEVHLENKKQDGKKERNIKFPHEISASDDDWPYYIRNNHAIIRIKLKDKDAVSARISENELKYLVLLIFENKGKEAIQKLGDYIFDMSQKIRYDNYEPKDARRIPSFLKITRKEPTYEEVNNRLTHIRRELGKIIETIEKELKESKWLIYKGKKITIILKFLSSSIADIKKRFNVEQHDALRDMLQKLKFDEFYKRLSSYVGDGTLDKKTYESIQGIKDISQLCKKACELRLARLDELEKNGGSVLYRYIGLEAEEKNKEYEKLNTNQAKAERFLESQFSTGKDFLRESFYEQEREQKKSLIKIVKEQFANVVPMNEERWYLMNKNPKKFKDKDNKAIKALCNTYVQDILCMKIARWYYEGLSHAYKDKIEWDSTVETGGCGYTRFRLNYKTDCGVVIEFKPSDFTRLDIIEKPKMVENICRSFITSNNDKKRTISWYDFNKEGVTKYRKQQVKAIERIFAFEKGLKIQDEKWQVQGYVPFIKRPEYENKGFKTFILEDAIQQSKIAEADKETLNKVRKDYFHEQFFSSDEDRKVFEKCMPVVDDKKKFGKKNNRMYGKKG
ncbi:MAG: hypothetical protein WDA68_07535 [Phycisphaerae bacterium]